MSIKGKVALITGTSRGIGTAIARRFAQEGVRVALHGRDEAALEKTADEIAASGGRIMTVTGDVTSFSDVEAMRLAVEGRLGTLDILVANAGGSFTVPGPFELIPEEGWRASVEGNLMATFLTIKSFLPGMKARKSGLIITISSSAARKVTGMSPVPYSAAKAGIQQMTQQLAAEVGQFGIRVNCIAPESILTERNLERIPAAAQESMVQAHPLRRPGTPQDVAEAALFLASDASSWVTGVILDVAGGAVFA